MEIRRIRALRGPNIWSRRPVLEAWVDLGDLNDTSSETVPGFIDRLMALLPGLIEHRCSVGERGGFLQRLQRGTYPAHIMEHSCLELQTMAGTPVGFGKARAATQEGLYRVVVRYEEEAVGRAALVLARDLLMALYRGRPFELEPGLAALRELAEDVRLGPSTAAIVAAAEARGIPTRRLNAGSLVQLGQGVRQRRIWTAETDGTSAIAESIAQDKELTRRLLQAAGVPVPSGRVVSDADDAWQAAQDVGLPVVVKPRDGNHGRGVFVNLTTETLVREAWAAARAEGSGVIVETFAPGSEHRLLVVGHKLVAAARGDEAVVQGDGRSTVAQLVAQQLNSDPRRGESHNSPLAPIEFDPPTLAVLASQGLTPDAVPAADARVLIQRNGNLRTDCTDEVHPSVAAHVEMASRVVGLDIAGIDVVATDIAQPLEAQGGVLVEVNASPGLHAHLMPGVGQPRPVGEAIVGTLFAPGETGRIPLACITGTNGKTVVTELLAHLLRDSGRVVGTATSDGVQVGARQIDTGDCSGPRSARRLLLHPRVEAAVLELGRGGILREGLGFDRCDVAIVTNIGRGDHLGIDAIETPEDMFTVKRCGVDVVLPHGAAVLNAADPLVADMARLSAGRVILFAVDAHCPALRTHLDGGGAAVFVNESQLMASIDGAATPLAALDEIPSLASGALHRENLLAAVGGALGLRLAGVHGLDDDSLRRGLRTFAGVPGRMALFDFGHGATVLVDDAHNTDALETLLQQLDREPASSRRSVVYSAGARRRDSDVIAQGRLLGAGFDRVVLYEDASADDRPEGGITALLREGIAAAAPLRARELLDCAEYELAVEHALRTLQPGELLVVQTEDSGVARALQLVRSAQRHHD